MLLGSIPAAPVYALMAFSVALTVMGHVFRDQRIVAVGVTLLFVATALLILGAFQAYDEGGRTSVLPGG